MNESIITNIEEVIDENILLLNNIHSLTDDEFLHQMKKVTDTFTYRMTDLYFQHQIKASRTALENYMNDIFHRNFKGKIINNQEVNHELLVNQLKRVSDLILEEPDSVVNLQNDYQNQIEYQKRQSNKEMNSLKEAIFVEMNRTLNDPRLILRENSQIEIRGHIRKLHDNWSEIYQSYINQKYYKKGSIVNECFATIHTLLDKAKETTKEKSELESKFEEVSKPLVSNQELFDKVFEKVQEKDTSKSNVEDWLKPFAEGLEKPLKEESVPAIDKPIELNNNVINESTLNQIKIEELKEKKAELVNQYVDSSGKVWQDLPNDVFKF